MYDLTEIYICNIGCAIIVFDLLSTEYLDMALKLRLLLLKSKGNDEIELDYNSNTH